MPKFSLREPEWDKVFTNYRKYTVSFGDDDDDKTSFKVPVFERGTLEHALKWRVLFQDLVRQKNLNAQAKFANANLLVSGDAARKWTQARDEILGGDAMTDARFRNTMNRFMQKCGATNGTAEDLRDYLMNVKKPSNMKFSDFQTRVLELNSYLPYLPPPLNTPLDEDTLFSTFKKSVPAWKKKYIESNARNTIDDTQGLVEYYEGLEDQEDQDRQRRNASGRGRGRGSGRQQQSRDRRGGRNRRENYHMDTRGNRRNDNSGEDNQQGRNDSHRYQDNNRRSGNGYQRRGNHSYENRRNGNNNGSSQANSGHRYNLRDRRRNDNQENFHVDEEDARSEVSEQSESSSSQGTNASEGTNEFYFIHDNSHSDEEEEFWSDSDDDVPPLQGEDNSDEESDDESESSDEEMDYEDSDSIANLPTSLPGLVSRQDSENMTNDKDTFNTEDEEEEMIQVSRETYGYQNLPEEVHLAIRNEISPVQQVFQVDEGNAAQAEEDYRPEVVIAIPRDPSGKTKTFLRALVDSGSTKTHANIDRIPKWIRDQSTQPNDGHSSFVGWGAEFRVERKVKLPFILTQFAPNRKVHHEIYLSKTKANSESAPDMILGRDLIRKLRLDLNFKEDVPLIVWEDIGVPMVKRGYWTRERLKETFLVQDNPTLQTAEENFENKSPSMLAADYTKTNISELIPIHLNHAERRQLYHVLRRFSKLFSGKLGRFPGKPIHLELTDPNAKPYHGKPYQVPRSLYATLKAEVDRLCSIGVLRKVNSSEWAAQGFAVPKANGQIRFVTDFRFLNKYLRRFPFPLPSIQEIMRTVDGLTYVSVLDLNMGFWHLELDEPSQRLATIILPWGKYCYQRLAMGLSVSPDIYQERMAAIFADMENVIVFIDDIAILTKGSYQDHLESLAEVLQRLQDHDLQVNGKKSTFCAQEAEFLGFVLTRAGVKPQPKKVEAVLKLDEPKNVKQVRSFVGMVNYYKDHIPKRSELLHPLTSLTKKGARFKWTAECQHSFNTLKQLLAKRVVLAYPDFTKPFEIYTDASTKQIGAVIQQNGNPLAFYSRKLTDPQTRYTVIELELLAIVETLQEYRTILLGHPIKIYTDHKNLTFANFTTDRVRRWRLIVEEYGPEIIYFPGNKNIVADFLSRHPIQAAPINETNFFDELYEADNNDSFPLDFETIAQAQQADPLCRRAASQPGYQTRIVGRVSLVYFHDKIVVPTNLQPRILEWYHVMLAHPGEARTLETIRQHFTWKTLAKDVRKFVQMCERCQHYKKQRKSYGILPVKQHDPQQPWIEVHVDLIGPWTIPQRPRCKPKLSKTKDDDDEPFQLLALTAIDPVTNWIELVAIPNKESITVARAFDRAWLCRYPRPLKCLHDRGTEFTGIEFQELLQSYGIKDKTSSSGNPQSNAILERTHQVIANQLRSLLLMAVELVDLASLQQELLAPVQWAMNSTYHTTLQATPAQLAFQRDMILPTSFVAHWESMRQRRQATTDRDNFHENQRRIPHQYQVGDLVLIKTDAKGKLAKPTRGPYRLIDVSKQAINGTVVVDLNHSTEAFNIRRLLPFHRPSH